MRTTLTFLTGTALLLGSLTAATAPPETVSKPPAPTASNEARKRIEDLQVGVNFDATSPGKISGQWIGFRPKGGKWMDPGKGVDISRYKNSVEAARVRYTFTGPASIDLEIHGTPDLVYIGRQNIDIHPALPAPWREKLDVAASAKATVVSELHGAIKLDWEAGLSSADQERCYGQARPELLAKLAAKERFIFIFDGQWVAVAQLVEHGGKCALATRSVVPIEEASGLGDSAMQVIRAQADACREYKALRTTQIPQGDYSFESTPWERKLESTKDANIAYFQGCWHCSKRPDLVTPSDFCPRQCPGCQHLPGCEGDDPANCLGCRAGASTKHVVTRDEQLAFNRRMEQFIAQPEGTTVVERHIAIPCLHEKATLRRTVVQRAWRFETSISIESGFPPIDAAVLLPSNNARSFDVNVADKSSGTQVLRIIARVEEQQKKPKSGATAEGLHEGPPAPRGTSGGQLSHVELLQENRVLVKLKDGRVFRLCAGTSNGKVRLEFPGFADWTAVNVKLGP